MSAPRVPDRCGEQFAWHPTRPELVAVCTLPPGHDGPHDNLLPKPDEAILRNTALDVRHQRRPR